MYLIKKIILIGMALCFLSCGLKIGEQSGAYEDFEGFSLGCLNGISGKVDLYLKGQLTDKDIVQTANCIKVALTVFKDRIHGQKKGEFTPNELRKFMQDLFLQDNIVRDKLLNQLARLKVVILGGEENTLTIQDIERFIFFVEKLKTEAIFFQPYFEAFYVLSQNGKEGNISQLKNIERGLQKSINRVSVFFKSFANPYDIKDIGLLFQELDFFPDHQHNISHLKEKISLLGALKSFVFGSSDTLIKPEEWSSFLTAFSYLLSIHVHWTVLKKQDQWVSLQGFLNFSSIINNFIQFLSFTVQKRPQSPAGINDFLNLSKHLRLAGFLPEKIGEPAIKSVFKVFFGKVFIHKNNNLLAKADVNQTAKPLETDESKAPPREQKAFESPFWKKNNSLQQMKRDFEGPVPISRPKLSITPQDSLSTENPATNAQGSDSQNKRNESKMVAKENRPSQKGSPTVVAQEVPPVDIKLTWEHISTLQQFFQLWVATQTFLDSQYDGKDTYDQENISLLLTQAKPFFSTPALWTKKGEALIRDIFSMKPLYQQGKKIHLSASMYDLTEPLDYKNAKIYSFYRFIAEMIKTGYKKTSPENEGMSQEELKDFFADFRPLAVSMGWLTPRSKTSVMGEGEAEFIAANMLTATAKGFHPDWQKEEYLSSNEIAEYLSYALSFGFHLAEIGPALFALCGESGPHLSPEEVTWQNSQYSKSCVRLHLIPLLKKHSLNLPDFQKSLESMNETAKIQLAEALIHISFSTEEQYQQADYINKENIKNIIMALYFVETTITRYDKNHNLTLEHEEIMDLAFPIFRGYLSRVIIHLNCLESDHAVEDFYAYFLEKGILPTSRKLSLWDKVEAKADLWLHSFHRQYTDSEYWNLHLDRTKLTRRFSTLVKGLLSKKKDRKGQECHQQNENTEPLPQIPSSIP